MRKFIELTHEGRPVSVNSHFITGVVGEPTGGCRIYVQGDSDPFYCDEGYEEVMRKIPSEDEA